MKEEKRKTKNELLLVIKSELLIPVCSNIIANLYISTKSLEIINNLC